MQDSLTTRAFAYVKEKHAGQFRAGNVPMWHHVARVSALLETMLGYTKEGDKDMRRDIMLAGLGHDLLEDTDATTKEIVEVFGKRPYAMIYDLTNEWGDEYPEPYVAKMTAAREESRLVKLSDLFDNVTHGTAHLRELGKTWATDFFLPIMAPMHKAMMKTEFTAYPKTAQELTHLVEAAIAMFDRELEYYFGTSPVQEGTLTSAFTHT